jgi:hypothetical protein
MEIGRGLADYGERAALALAQRAEQLELGVYGKVRGGYLRSKYTLVTYPPAEVTDSDFVIDYGVILELRTPGRLSLRVDAGDLWIPSSQRNSHPFDAHNLRIGVGASWSLN